MEGIDALNSWKPNLEHKTGNCGPGMPKSGQNSKMVFRPQIIKKAIKKLKSNFAAGPDDIPPILIKNCAPELAPILSKLFQLSYESGIFSKAEKYPELLLFQKKVTLPKSPITDLLRSALLSPKEWKWLLTNTSSVTSKIIK